MIESTNSFTLVKRRVHCWYDVCDEIYSFNEAFNIKYNKDEPKRKNRYAIHLKKCYEAGNVSVGLLGKSSRNYD